MSTKPVHILCVIGPTASGKSARAVKEALARDGEIISVDSRQVYRGLNIGTEKITRAEMQGVPHYLIDIREPHETYSAGEFVADATKRITDITTRGKLPILVGGTHFYFDALIRGLPPIAPNEVLRQSLRDKTPEDLYALVLAKDPERAQVLDSQNKRRLIRALEILETAPTVPPRSAAPWLEIEWMVLNPDTQQLRELLRKRLEKAFANGLVDEVRAVRDIVGDTRLNEFGIEYRVIGEYLRGERIEETLFEALVAKLVQYARHQRAWLRKLADENVIAATELHQSSS